MLLLKSTSVSIVVNSRKLPIRVPIGGNGSSAKPSKVLPLNTGLISPAASSSGSNAPGSPMNARKSSGERMSASVMSSSPSSGAIGSLRSMTPSCGAAASMTGTGSPSCGTARRARPRLIRAIATER